jgi:acyl carrier protein
MTITREQIMQDVLDLLQRLAEDWEYTDPITPQTRFFADMGLASLDVVVLGTAVQQHYGRVLPFTDLFAEVGQRELPDIPVGEWVDFIYDCLMQLEKGPLPASPTAGGGNEGGDVPASPPAGETEGPFSDHTSGRGRDVAASPPLGGTEGGAR